MSCLPPELIDDKSKIFICSSAYQVYVASKLVQAFDVKEPILFVGGKEHPPKVTNTLLALIDWQQIHYLVANANRPGDFWRLYRSLRQLKPLINDAHIFSGGLGETYIAMILGFYNVSSVSILDDGMQALQYLDGFYLDQSHTLKRKIFNFLLGSFLNGKILGFRDVYDMAQRFYTFFDVNVDPRTVHVPLEGLSSEFSKKVKMKKCIILGQPLYEAGILPTYQAYTEIITAISTSLSMAGFDLYYYPHPREQILPDKCWNNISIIKGEDIIQVWIETNFIPEMFVGLTTTALISLHLLLPETKFIAYDITDCAISNLKQMYNMYDMMSKYDIEVRSLS